MIPGSDPRYFRPPLPGSRYPEWLGEVRRLHVPPAERHRILRALDVWHGTSWGAVGVRERWLSVYGDPFVEPGVAVAVDGDAHALGLFDVSDWPSPDGRPPRPLTVRPGTILGAWVAARPRVEGLYRVRPVQPLLQLPHRRGESLARFQSDGWLLDGDPLQQYKAEEFAYWFDAHERAADGTVAP